MQNKNQLLETETTEIKSTLDRPVFFKKRRMTNHWSKLPREVSASSSLAKILVKPDCLSRRYSLFKERRLFSQTFITEFNVDIMG